MRTARAAPRHGRLASISHLLASGSSESPANVCRQRLTAPNCDAIDAIAPSPRRHEKSTGRCLPATDCRVAVRRAIFFDRTPMSPASINGASFWANQISVVRAQRMMTAATATAPGGSPPAGSLTSGTAGVGSGGGLFANLLSTLSAKVASSSRAVSGPGGATSSTATATAATASRAQIAQDFQAFTQSLLQTLASKQPAPLQSGGSAGATATGTGASLINSGSGAASAAGTASSRGYGHGHGHGGMRSRLESLISALNNNGSPSASASAPSASANKNVSDLNAAFNKLTTDLGVNSSSSGAASAVSNSNASTALQGLLQGMLQHLQQQGSLAASAGHVVNVIA